MGEEDFALKPFHLQEDAENEEDAKNDDTFGKFAAVDEIDDDWRPDEGAVGIFEALRAATHEERLRHHQQPKNLPDQEQLQHSPQQIRDGNSLLFAEQREQSSAHGSQMHPLLQSSDPRQEPAHSFTWGADAAAGAAQKLHVMRQYEQSDSLRQREEKQQSQQQNEQRSSGPPTHNPPFFLLSSRSSVTEQLDKLIALKRQQQQQQQPVLPPSAAGVPVDGAGPSLRRGSSSFFPTQSDEAASTPFAKQSIERACSIRRPPTFAAQVVLEQRQPQSQPHQQQQLVHHQQQQQVASQHRLGLQEPVRAQAEVLESQQRRWFPLPQQKEQVSGTTTGALGVTANAVVAPNALHHPARRGSFDSGEDDERMVMQMLTDPSVTAAAVAALNAAEAAVLAGGSLEQQLQESHNNNRGKAGCCFVSPVVDLDSEQRPDHNDDDGLLLQFLQQQPSTAFLQSSSATTSNYSAAALAPTPLEAAPTTATPSGRSRDPGQQQLRRDDGTLLSWTASHANPPPGISLQQERPLFLSQQQQLLQQVSNQMQQPLHVLYDVATNNDLLSASRVKPLSQSQQQPPQQHQQQQKSQILLREPPDSNKTERLSTHRILTEAEVVAMLTASNKKSTHHHSTCCSPKKTMLLPMPFFSKTEATSSFLQHQQEQQEQHEQNRQQSTNRGAVSENFDSCGAFVALQQQQQQSLQQQTIKQERQDHAHQSHTQSRELMEFLKSSLKLGATPPAPLSQGKASTKTVVPVVAAAPVRRGEVLQQQQQRQEEPQLQQLQGQSRQQKQQQKQLRSESLCEKEASQRSVCESFGGRIAAAVSVSVEKSAGAVKTTEKAAAKAASAVLAQVKAAGLFPFTQAHRSAALQQRVTDLPPWRLPLHLRGNSRSGKESKTHEQMVQQKPLRQPLMTSFDLDYILRLQLTNMAKLPHLQLINGRWNFRFLRRQATSSSQQLPGGVLTGKNGRLPTAAADQSETDRFLLQQQQLLLPSSPLEMEQHLRRLLLHQETLKQQFPQVLLSRGSSRSGGDETLNSTSGYNTKQGETGLLFLLPEALERKLHGGTGVSVVSNSARMHRLLLGSLSLQEASDMLQPLLLQGRASSSREGASDDSSNSSSATAAEMKSAFEGLTEEAQQAHMMLLEPLEAEPDSETEGLISPGVSRERSVRISSEMESQQQKKQQQQQQQTDASAQERELRRLQKRFGKPTYCTVRQPRSSIHIGSAPAVDGTSRPAAGVSTAEKDEDEVADHLLSAPVIGKAQQLQPELPYQEGLALGASAAQCADDKSRRRLVRSLVFGNGSVCLLKSHGAAAFAQHLTGLHVIEDAFDVLLEAEALEEELLEGSASHAHARTRLLEQQQHFLQQLLELLLLRRCVSGVSTPDRSFLFSLDVHPSACVDSIEAYVSFFRKSVQQQQHTDEKLQSHPLVQEQQPSSQQTKPQQHELMQQQQQLTVQVEEGRACTRWMLTQVYSNAKGRQLLLRALLLLSEAHAALLLQGLCSCATVLQSVCAAADAALVKPQQIRQPPQSSCRGEEGLNTATSDVGGVVITNQDEELARKQQLQQQEKKSEAEGEAVVTAQGCTVSCAELFEDLLLLLDGTSNICNAGKGRLLSLMRETTEGLLSFAAPLYVQLMQLLLRVGSRSTAGSVWFMTGLCQQIIWGLSRSALVQLLQWRSACCLFASIIALLPAPASLSPDQSTTMLTLLNLVVTALLTISAAPSSKSATTATALEEKTQQEQLLAPLVQAVVQQAHLHEARAQAITTAAVDLLGLEGAQTALVSFLQGRPT